jgi:peptidoglycan/LPS O-acetylase OafA/YrhL
VRPANEGVVASGTCGVPKQAVRDGSAASDDGGASLRPRGHEASDEQPSRVAFRKFRPDIEGLRAIAVGTVVLAHSGLALKGGYIGVDVFFVISGFLITRQLHDELRKSGRVSFSGFYARRARRILPAAVVVILATLTASWAWLSPLRLHAITRDAIFSAISGINWRLAVQGTDYFQSSAPPSPFQHYWSLAVEEQFYVIWPLLLVVSALVFGRLIGRQRAIVGSLVLVVAVSCYLSITVTATSAPWAYFGSHTRAWELGIGALIAVSAGSWSRLPSAAAAVLSWLGVVMIGIAAWRFNDDTPYPGSAALLPVLGAAMVIAAGCAASNRGAEILLKLAPMQFGGRVSYSWYLWHWPVLIIAPEVIGHKLTVTESLLAIGLSLVLATLTFRLVEQPIRTRKGLVEFPQRGIGLGIAMVTMATVAAVALGANVALPGSSAGSKPGKAAGVRTALSDAGPLVSGVSQMVIDATKITKLPAVTPALDKAQSDSANSRNCFADYPNVAPNTSRDCVFGDPNGAKTMVLFGDSHAAQWSGPIQKWAEQNHWQMWLVVKAACSPGDYPGTVALKLHRVYTECPTWRDKALSFIDSLKPAFVVVSGNWVAESVGYPGMANSIRRIGSSGAKILFIADTPRMVVNVPDCLAQHPDNIQVCAVSMPESGLASSGRIAEIAGANSAGATVFQATPWLCTSETCPPVINNVVVYRDEGHLTNTYTLTLASQLGEALTGTAQTR